MAEEVPEGSMITILAGLLAFSIVGDVRKAAMGGDLAGAERIAAEHRNAQGATAEWLEAFSWLGRGALAAKNLDAAERYAAETRKHAMAMLKGRELDAERHLPIALGAAIEVQGQTLAARGDRAAALEYLNTELERFRNTSIRTRLQKNINLLSLEGKTAPPLQGAKLPAKPALLFFWAHWCGDCKSMAEPLAQMQKDFPGVAIIAPTQLYGYAARGEDAGPEEERRYLRGIQKQFYGTLGNVPAPISDENFKVYGASTTPTLVLVDKAGIVRMYHPGRMTYDELRPKLQLLLK